MPRSHRRGSDPVLLTRGERIVIVAEDQLPGELEYALAFMAAQGLFPGYLDARQRADLAKGLTEILFERASKGLSGMIVVTGA